MVNGESMTTNRKRRWLVVVGFIIGLIALMRAIKLPDYRAYKERIAIFPLSSSHVLWQGKYCLLLGFQNK
jgi:hypothetical protein